MGLRSVPAALAVALLVCLLHGCNGFRTWQPIRELQKQVQSEHGDHILQTRSEAAELYAAYNLSVPIDHFHNDSLYEPHVDEKFNLRYWFDAEHYQSGGPVILLAAGETSGADRLPFLQKGVVAQMAKATHGIAVVLEHRYYGTSFPVANLSIESLRFLRTEQALADTAYFAQHVRFPGLEDVDLSPGKGAPWIVYGGSYAGVFAAFLRVLYPDVFWGAISSSGVTVAIYDYWRYYEAQRLYAPQACVQTTQKLVHAADQILLPRRPAAHGRGQTGGGSVPTLQQPMGTGGRGLPRRSAALVALLKATCGLGNVTDDADFASLLSDGMGTWQGTNWDPAVSSPGFAWYCANVTAATLLYPELGDRLPGVRSILAATTYADELDGLVTPMLNLIGWVHATHRCASGRTQDECFGNRNATFYRQTDLSQRWRSWPYQYCTQWGYLATGSGVPDGQLPLISRTLDLAYLSTICREAFNISALPDLDSVNRLGGFDISYPRLAIVDGEADPWRAATPHALAAAKDRQSTTDEPFLLIGGGAVHHWDENGLFANETTASLPPPPIRTVQAEEVAFVAQWVAQWTALSRNSQ